MSDTAMALIETRPEPMRRRVGFLLAAPKLVSFCVLLILAVALSAPFIAPYDPVEANLAVRQTPPAFVGGSLAHLLGTDRQGRDVFTRVVWGARISLTVAGLSILLGSVVGTGLGLVAGYSGGLVDTLIMRAVDILLTFPPILLALILVVAIGPSIIGLILVLSLILLAQYARLVRAEVLPLREREFVALARVAGCSTSWIILRHILPNVLNTIVVMSTLQVGYVILVEASLSFLGAGVPPPTPTWGGMVAEGRDYLDTLWWLSIMPGIAIAFVVLTFNLFGDWLRDVLDPKLQQL